LGQIAGGPPVGYIGDVFSVRAALVVSSIILSPVLLLLAVATRRGKAVATTVPIGEGVEPEAPELI